MIKFKSEHMNQLLKETLHKKMEKLERKLERYASHYFDDEYTVMYVRSRQIKEKP